MCLYLFSSVRLYYSVNVKVKVLVTQLCLTLCDAMDCGLPGSSVHGILQTRILEGVVIPFSKGSSWPRDWTQVSCIAGGFFTIWATREAPWYECIPSNLICWNLTPKVMALGDGVLWKWFSSVRLLSCVRLFATPRTAACQASLSIVNYQSTPKPMSIKSVMPSNHLILRHPLLLLPPIPPSIRVFSNESALCIRWPKYWSFSFNISPSNEHPGLISFRMDWLDLLAIQGTLKSLLQHHSSIASILWH